MNKIQKIDCNEIIEAIRKDISVNFEETATLAVVNVGHNPASDLYIKSKKAEAKKWNVKVELAQLPENIREVDLMEKVAELSYDSGVDGVIVQLPLPDKFDTKKILDMIPEDKNVDGFELRGKRSSNFLPCTPYGILMLLDYITRIEGKMVTVIGRGKTVGEPIAVLLTKRNATVAVCHSKTKKTTLKKLLKMSDIVVSAVGKPDLFNIEDVKNGAIIIDTGISRIDGKQIGDFSHDFTENKHILYTPWTNGVGKMTVAALMMNVRIAHDI